jgi:hypothetical protein
MAKIIAINGHHFPFDFQAKPDKSFCVYNWNQIRIQIITILMELK